MYNTTVEYRAYACPPMILMMFSYTVKTIPPLICSDESFYAWTNIQVYHSPPTARVSASFQSRIVASPPLSGSGNHNGTSFYTLAEH